MLLSLETLLRSHNMAAITQLGSAAPAIMGRRYGSFGRTNVIVIDPIGFVAMQVYNPGFQAAEVYSPGLQGIQAYNPGMQAMQSEDS